MYKSTQFTLVEWIFLFFIVPIPVANIVFLLFLVTRIGLPAILKKLLILFGIYVLLAIFALVYLELSA